MIYNLIEKQQHRQSTFALFCLAAALIFVGLGLRDPWPADEPRFAQVAKEMVETGQWFFPTRAGEYYPDKPPVFMWAIAFFYAMTGSIRIAFLLPSALSALLTLYLTYDLAKRLWGRQEALIAAGLLLFSFQFLMQAKTAQIDAMVCGWITTGCYGLLRFLLIERHWRWFYLAFFFMGVGVITKGVGFLPVLMLIPYYFYQKRFEHKLPSDSHSHNGWRWFTGPLIMLLAIALWALPMLLLVEYSQDPSLFQYRDNILFKQTVTRYADSWHHIKPFWYYLTDVIPLFWLPISLALPWLVPHWRRAIKAGDGRIILPLFWIILVLVFFSVSPGKRGVYILPALPMLALISSPFFSQITQRKGFSWLLWGIVILCASALVCFGVAGLIDLPFATKLEARFAISPWYLFITIGSAAMLSALLMRANHQRWHAWPAFMVVLWCGYSTWGYSLLEPVKTPKSVYNAIQQKLSDTPATIALVDAAEQFIFFAPYPIVHFGHNTPLPTQIRAAAQWVSNDDPHRYVLIDKAQISDTCFSAKNAVELGLAHRAQWILLSANDVLSSCPDVSPEVKTYHYLPLDTEPF